MAEGRKKDNYNMAVMVRAAVGANRMPGFEQFFPDSQQHGRKEPMTDEQMYQQVLMLNAALGGSVMGG
jgi:hypothetical protein